MTVHRRLRASPLRRIWLAALGAVAFAFALGNGMTDALAAPDPKPAASLNPFRPLRGQAPKSPVRSLVW